MSCRRWSSTQLFSLQVSRLFCAAYLQDYLSLTCSARRNVPVRYNRDLVQKTLQTMQRVSEIRARRERVFYKNRMKGNKQRQRDADRKLVEVSTPLSKERTLLMLLTGKPTSIAAEVTRSGGSCGGEGGHRPENGDRAQETGGRGGKRERRGAARQGDQNQEEDKAKTCQRRRTRGYGCGRLNGSRHLDLSHKHYWSGTAFSGVWFSAVGSVLQEMQEMHIPSKRCTTVDVIIHLFFLFVALKPAMSK
jgi:hypothetical protein